MKTVILAGGYGTRFAEMTELMPKPMIPIGGKPILWHIMNHFASFGHTDFILCLGYKADIIRNYVVNLSHNLSDFTVNLGTGEIEYTSKSPNNWKVTLVDTGLDSGTGGRLAQIKPYLDNTPFFMTYGDGLSDVNLDHLLAHHRKFQKKATVTAVIPPSRYGCLTIKDDTVTNFDEKPAVVGSEGRINGGFFVMEKSALEAIESNTEMWEDEPINKIVSEGELAAYMHTGFWQCMDTLRDQKYLEEIWQKGQAPWMS